MTGNSRRMREEIARLRRTHPEVVILVIDPKEEPGATTTEGSRHYYSPPTNRVCKGRNLDFYYPSFGLYSMQPIHTEATQSGRLLVGDHARICTRVYYYYNDSRRNNGGSSDKQGKTGEGH
jgi:hypothetical protein